MFCTVPIILTAALHGLRWGFLTSGLFTALVIFLIKTGHNAILMILFVVLFNLAPIAGFMVYGVFKKHKKTHEKKITEAENSYQQLVNKDEQIRNQNEKLEKEVLDMARLYEITKAMSLSMDFAGIFEIFSGYLQKLFSFAQARLILTQSGAAQEKPVIQKIYPIETQTSEKTRKTIKSTQLDEKLLDVCLEKMSPTITEDANVAAPLISQNRLVGIVYAENINPREVDRFLIVCGQFGLELEKVRLYEMVQELAIIDGLTGLFVRRHLLERFQDELRRSIRHKLNLSTLMVDIDYFKNCNDRYGHLVGDVILKTIAQIIKENVREVDLVGRYGGEEFYIILPDTDKAGGVHVAERLRKSVERHTFLAYDEKVKVTVSVGVSIFPEDASSLEQLIDYADRAMYRAKNQGRNEVIAHSA